MDRKDLGCCLIGRGTGCEGTAPSDSAVGRREYQPRRIVGRRKGSRVGALRREGLHSDLTTEAVARFVGNRRSLVA